MMSHPGGAPGGRGASEEDLLHRPALHHAQEYTLGPRLGAGGGGGGGAGAGAGGGGAGGGGGEGGGKMFPKRKKCTEKWCIWLEELVRPLI